MEDTDRLISQNGKKVLHRSNGHSNGGMDKRVVGTFTEEPLFKPRITEQSLAGVLFLITVLILIGKLTFMLKSSVQSALEWRQLVRAMWIDPATGQEYMKYYWESGFRGQYLIWPLLCGLAAFAFSWIITYFDSRVPGIDPPMPNFFGSSSNSRRYSSQRSTGWSLAYQTSFLTGLLTFFVFLISHKL
ncbi:uncharacterized protein LOC129795715 [Lutzomyia longipalpis]|nr:uncharacterized protein LOC129795715 [Lutzomyia longipalpis]